MIIILLIKFFEIFPIQSSLSTAPSIILFVLLSIGLAVAITDIIFMTMDFNKNVYCPYDTSFNPNTITCDPGCNNDDHHCAPGYKCIGNKCCMNSNVCGDSCCDPKYCIDRKYCCVNKCIDAKTGKITCCSDGTTCDETIGQCVLKCGSATCGPNNVCLSWKLDDDSQQDNISCPTDKKNYDKDSKTLYCCFPKPSTGCAYVKTQSLPTTGNFTSCFSSLGQDDQSQIDDEMNKMLNYDGDAFSKSPIMNYGENKDKNGFFCGYDGPLYRAEQSILSSQDDSCQSGSLICQDFITTDTDRMNTIYDSEIN
jgi:hypothetical protein